MMGMEREGKQEVGRSGAGAPSGCQPSASAVPASQSGIPNAKRPDMAQRLGEFETALFETPWIAERVLAGQQFNAYDDASNYEDDEPEDWEYHLCLGPITDHRFICRIVGEDRARVVEAAMKVATEAFRERAASAMSGRSPETEGLSPKDASAVDEAETPNPSGLDGQ